MTDVVERLHFSATLQSGSLAAIGAQLAPEAGTVYVIEKVDALNETGEPAFFRLVMRDDQGADTPLTASDVELPANSQIDNMSPYRHAPDGVTLLGRASANDAVFVEVTVLALREELTMAVAEAIIAATGPSKNGVSITPSDTVELSPRPRALLIGAAGDLSVIFEDAPGETVVALGPVMAGTLLPIGVRKVMATGTTAAQITALY